MTSDLRRRLYGTPLEAAAEEIELAIGDLMAAGRYDMAGQLSAVLIEIRVSHANRNRRPKP